jgi:hypothetical protein
MERPQSVQATLVVKAQPDFVAFAQLLGEDEAAELQQETLDEEGDKLLTQLAQEIVNPEALLEDAEAEATGSRSR